MGHVGAPEDLRISATVLFAVTLVVTSYRCLSRFSKRIWGHDDSVALFSSLIFALFVIGSTLVATSSASSRMQRVVGTYVMIAGFYTSVWGARISIVLTVIRVTPWQPQKKILLWAVALFVILYLVLLIQAYWICQYTRTGWKNVPGSICIFPKVVPITQLIATVISDGILVATPLMILKGVCVPPLRFRLFSIFSMSLGTTLASLAHVILLMIKPGATSAIFGGVESAVSIIVSSMSVIVPATYRALGVGDPFMQEDTVDPGFATTAEIARMTLTRVELGLPVTRGATVAPGGNDPERPASTVIPPKRNSAGLDAGCDQKHRLATQLSDGSLGTSVTTKVVSHCDECDITDSLALEVGSLPVIKKNRDTLSDVEGSRAKRKAT